MTINSDAFALGGRQNADTELLATDADTTADPVLALAAERQRLFREHFRVLDAHAARHDAMAPEARDGDATLAALDREVKETCKRWGAAEERFLATPASTTAGLLAQLALMREFAEVYDGSSLIEPLATIEAGIKRIGRVA